MKPPFVILKEVLQKRGMSMSIQIQVKLDLKSLGRFLIYHYYTQVSGIISVIISAAALAGLILRWSQWPLMQKGILIVLALMFTVLQPVMLVWRGNKQLQSEEFQEPFHYVFDDNGVTISQKRDMQQFTWEDVRKIRYRKDAMYVYMSTVSAFVIPSEQCDGQFEKLVQLSKEKKAK